MQLIDIRTERSNPGKNGYFSGVIVLKTGHVSATVAWCTYNDDGELIIDTFVSPSKSDLFRACQENLSAIDAWIVDHLLNENEMAAR